MPLYCPPHIPHRSPWVCLEDKTDLVFVHVCDSIVVWFASPKWHEDIVKFFLENSGPYICPIFYSGRHVGDGLVVCFDKKLCSRLLELACSLGERQDGVWNSWKSVWGCYSQDIVGFAHSSEAHGMMETKPMHAVGLGFKHLFLLKVETKHRLQLV